MFSWLGLAYVVAVWLLALATAWIGWVAYFRWVTMQERLKVARRRADLGEAMLGSAVDEEREPLSDEDEAFREQLARHKRAWERRMRQGVEG